MSNDWQTAGDIGRGVAALLVGIAAFILLILVIGAMFLFSFGWFSQSTADFRGRVGVAEKTKANANFRIASYDHFYDLCASVQSKESTIQALKAEAPSDAARASQVQGAITANLIQRNASINQYNADARKAGTSGQFRASDLPYQLDPNSEVTTCRA